MFFICKLMFLTYMAEFSRRRRILHVSQKSAGKKFSARRPLAHSVTTEKSVDDFHRSEVLEGKLASETQETQYEYQWSDKHKQVLEAHLNYHEEMTRFIEKVAKEGSEVTVLPPKPKERPKICPRNCVEVEGSKRFRPT